MSPVDFKKWPCRPVEFKGQGPHCVAVVREIREDHLSHTLLTGNNSARCRPNLQGVGPSSLPSVCCIQRGGGKSLTTAEGKVWDLAQGNP